VLRGKLKQMDARIAEVQRAHAVSSLGAETFGALLTQFNNCTFNIAFGAAPEAGCRDDITLAEIIIRVDSILFARRFRNVPDLKSNGCTGLYLCDPGTNVWSQKSNMVLENIILEQLAAVPAGALSDAETRRVRWRKGCADILYAIARKYIDEKFDQRLDVNRDLFALDNVVVDMRTKTKRAIEPEDLVRTTTNWSYDAEEAAAKRRDVETFFEQVFPVPEERHVVLAFFASSLSGDRGSKRFLALTDRRIGGNGKSCLVALLGCFFGSYQASSTKFVCEGTFQPDRNSHDAGLEPYRATRLLIAEELKHNMRLDPGLLKKVVGGNQVAVEGRKFGSGDRFTFTWQSNLLLVFNDGDCPGSDGDPALMSRMIVAPMRSKFVFSMEGWEGEELTYLASTSIHEDFPSWRSALLDILLDNVDPACLHDPPADMLKWKQDVARDSNPISTWIEPHIDVTGDKLHALIFPELYTRFKEDRSRNARQFSDDTFERLAKNYLLNVALSFKEKDNVKICEKNWKTGYGGVFKGVRLRPEAARREAMEDEDVE
jgi:hypothetical protein